MKHLRTLLLFCIVTFFAASNMFAQNAQPYIGVLATGTGTVAVGGTLDLTITVGNTGSTTIPFAKLRPNVIVPASVTFLPDAQQTGLPTGWTILANTGSQLRLCNTTATVSGLQNIPITLKVQGVTVAPFTACTGQIFFGNGTTCAPGTSVAGNNTADDFSTSSIEVIPAAACTITASATAGTIACNGGTTTLTAASAGTTNPVEYSINGTTFQTGTTFTVPAGTYTVTAREIATPTCTATASPVVIASPAAFVPSASVSSPIATIGGTGSITVTGGAPYTIATGTTINTTGATSGVFIGLLAGTYTLTATNTTTGCVGTSTAVVLNNPAACIITGVTTSAGTIACNGGTTTLTATAAPAGAYQYSLNGGTFQASNTFTVPQGSYTVTAREIANNACTATSTALVVAQPDPFIATSVPSTISCNGGTGSITTTSTGGSIVDALIEGPGGFSSDNSTGNFAGLFAGAYTLTLENAAGCISTTNVTLNQPSPIVVSATFAPITTFGGSTTVTVAATGGVAPYTGTGTFVRTDGTFTFTVNDANNCPKSTTITINPFSTPVTADPAVGQMDFTTVANTLQNANTLMFAPVYKLNVPFYNRSQDNAVPNGTIQVRVNLGTKLNIDPAFTLATAPLNNIFTWSTTTVLDSVIIIGTQNAAIPADFDGTFTFNVKGKATCAANVRTRIIVTNTGALLNDEDLLNNASTLQYTLPATVAYTQTNVRCNGAANGIINVVTSPGATFVVRNSANVTVTGGTVSPVTGLAPGVYTITATGTSEVGLGIVCNVNTTVTIVQPTVLAATNNAGATVNNICNGGNIGALTVVSTGGTAPYAYTIAGPTVNTTGAVTGTFTNLLAGTYTVTSTDANGCTATASGIIITQPTGTAPDISIGSDITGSLFATNGTSQTVVYNVTEIAGNPAVGDTIRINRVSGFNISFNPSIASTTVGSTTYTLDNARWKIDNSNATFVSIILTDPTNVTNPGTLLCNQRVNVSITLTRNTPNISTFTLSARLRRANGEINLSNNLNSIVLAGE